MASGTSTGLRLELITPGEKDNTWGSITNTNLTILDRTLSGHTVVEMDFPTKTLSVTDFVLATWHNMSFKVTGVLTQASALVVPAFPKTFFVENATTGDFFFEVRPSGGTGVGIPRGERAILFFDGTNIIGTVLQKQSSNLSAISALASAGLAFRKSDGTWAARTLTGTAEQITVTNGDGTDGNPTLSLSANMLLPGTLRTTGRLDVLNGGMTVFNGGATIGGTVRLTGPNETLVIASSSGFGGAEVFGPSGATIDLKNAEAKDFDCRFLSENGNSWMIGQQAVNLQTLNNFNVIQHIVGSTVRTITNSQGLAVVGRFECSSPGASDAPIISVNGLRAWDSGVRSNGWWSLRNQGSDVLVINASTSELFVNSGLTVSVGNVVIPNGGLTCNGAVNFSASTSFRSKGILDVAPSSTLTIGANKCIGINQIGPAAMLHIGATNIASSPVAQFDSGGPAGFRQWAMGQNYGDFNFFINDTTAGVRRFTVEWSSGRTTINGGLSVTNGQSILSDRLTVTAGGAALAGGTTLSKAGGSHSLTIVNPSNTGGDGCQVFYNGQNFNVFTRISQSTGAFEFVNTAYSGITASITQAGQIFNATGTYGTLSDIRLKENVSTSASFLDRMKQLRVVDYSLISAERDTADQVGFIAHEVEQVFPELVVDCGDVGDIDHVKVVATSNLVPMLVSVIQELTARIEALEASNAI